MFRITLCFILLFGTVANLRADDEGGTTEDKQTLPKSFVIELTRITLQDATADSVAGLTGARLDAQIREWQSSDQIASQESLSLTTVENMESSAQFGRRLAVVTGTTSGFGGSRVARQSSWQDTGTIVQATITSREGHVIVELNYEASAYEPSKEEDALGQTITISIDTNLVLKPGEKQVISNAQGDDRSVLLVEVSESGQARAVRRAPTSRPSSGRRPDPRRTQSSRSGTPPSRSGSPSSRSGGSPSRSGRTSTPPDDRLSRFAEAMLSRYDTNKDGILDEKETDSGFLGGRFKDVDSNNDGQLSSEELIEYVKSRTRN